MSDEYLWDRGEPVDPDVAALERLLAPYGATTGPAARPPQWSVPPRPVTTRFAGTVLAAAAVALLAVGVAWLGPRPLPSGTAAGDGWALAPLRGRPLLAAEAIDGPRTVRPGAWIDTGASASARLDLGDGGRVIIAPDSRLQVTRATADDRRVHLAYGSIDALVWAPPGQVVVSMPAATAVDLGCAYTLTLDRQGRGALRVTTGWVGLVHEGREAFVPAGARVGIDPRTGPGTPVLVRGSEALHEAVTRFDVGEGATRDAALEVILREAAPGDALTLWHLLSRVAPADRGRVYDALAARLAPPDGVTRAGIVAGQQPMLDAWWGALGYGDRGWWDLWLREWRPAS